MKLWRIPLLAGLGVLLFIVIGGLYPLLFVSLLIAASIYGFVYAKPVPSISSLLEVRRG